MKTVCSLKSVFWSNRRLPSCFLSRLTRSRCKPHTWLCPLFCLTGSSLQEYGSLSGQSVGQTHLLRPGNTHLLGSLSADSDITFSGVDVCLVSRCDLCFVSQVSVPKDLVAVMSAVRDGQEVDPQDNSRIVYRFRQPVSSLFFTYLLMMMCDVIF